MTDPQFRYARTSDGVNIAWYAIGDGLPWLWPSTPPSHVQFQWTIPELREAIEIFPRAGARVVTYDSRGFGLSDRGPGIDHSLESAVRDMEAVMDAAFPDRPVVLHGFSHMGMPLLAYAARHPDRVLALVLQNGIMSGADLSDRWHRLVRTAAEEWDDAKSILARTNESGWAMAISSLELTREMLSRASSQEEFLAFARALDDWDVSGELSRITAPALVFHLTDSFRTTLDGSRRLATALHNSSFQIVERGEGQLDALRVMYLQFLREALPRPARAVQATTASGTGTAVILFTDIAESTALTERMGDDAFRAAARALDDQIRAAIRDAHGTPIDGKLLGDGVMATFAAARDAIEAARRCVELSAASELRLHVGLHAGDVVREPDNVYGGAVNIASRICGLCVPGEILVTQTVRDLARTSAGVGFEDRGEQKLKGISDAMRVYVVRTA